MIIRESKLIFDFNDNHWSDIRKFDEHIDYEKVKNYVSETKAVDFIGILNQKSVFYFEIKNFKDHRIENKERLNSNAEELTTEIAQKVRDSIACIVGANRNSTNDKELWNKILEFSVHKNLIIVLWLEQDNHLNKNKTKITDYQLKLKSKLKWLSGTSNNIRIINMSNCDSSLRINVTIE